MSASGLAMSEVWWCGPAFLRHKEELWPTKDIIVPTHLTGELRRNLALCFEVAPMVSPSFRLHPERHSSWLRLARVTGWCKRFTSRARKKSATTTGSVTTAIAAGDVVVQVPELSAAEVEKAQQFWILTAQCEAYGEVFEALKRGKPLPGNHPLRKLNPGLSPNKPIRLLEVQGHLDEAELPRSVQCPVIYPPKHVVNSTDHRC